jgi:hypothetical protein
MTSEKNLHASVPQSLLTQAQELAVLEQISLDELICDAVEKRVNRREFEEVFAFGKRHSRARGLKRSDVAKAIADVRGVKSSKR